MTGNAYSNVKSKSTSEKLSIHSNSFEFNFPFFKINSKVRKSIYLNNGPKTQNPPTETKEAWRFLGVAFQIFDLAFLKNCSIFFRTWINKRCNCKEVRLHRCSVFVIPDSSIGYDFLQSFEYY